MGDFFEDLYDKASAEVKSKTPSMKEYLSGTFEDAIGNIFGVKKTNAPAPVSQTSDLQKYLPIAAIAVVAVLLLRKG